MTDTGDLDWLCAHPHMHSPAHLACATMGEERFWLPPHLRLMNTEMVSVSLETARGVGGARVAVNAPPQHGKSLLFSTYYPAWHLLHFPDTRITLVGHGTDFARGQFGGRVKELVERWGKAVNVSLREDTRAKGEWRIEGREGGMFCTGPGGGAVGRPAELYLIDDLIRDHVQALSPVVLESHRSYWESVVQGRAVNQTSVFLIGTRWSRNDLFGHVYRQAQATGEPWKVLKFKALAEKDDPLGRQEGAPLWGARVSRARLEAIRKTSRWWRACWQQEPEDETGQYFRPRAWPTFRTLQDAWSCQEGNSRRVWGRSDSVVFASVDWAFSEKKTADFTAIGVFALVPGKRLLVLEVVEERLPPERWAGRLEQVCRRWRPSFVVAEANAVQGIMMKECQNHPGIPPLRSVGHKNQTKLQRAVEAIILGGDGKLYTPEDGAPWLQGFQEQLAAFNGLTDEHDDAVDCLAYAAKQAGWLTPAAGTGEPCVLAAGREGGFFF